jgi:uncharacterized protein YdaU (DUF1376 family)
MTKRPWFPFYAADWLSDARVTALTLPEQGAYIRLLAIQWREGFIPSCRRAIARLVGYGAVEMIASMDEDLYSVENVLELFEPDPSDPEKLRNRRLEEVREEADKKHDTSVENGRKGGLKRGLSVAQARLKQSQSQSQSKSQSQSQSYTENTIPDFQTKSGETQVEPESSKFDFEAVYLAYPRKDGKKKGLQRCRSQITSRSKYDALLRAVKNYAALVEAEARSPEYIKQFDSFMSVWQDYVEPTKPRAKKQMALGYSPAPDTHYEVSEDVTDKL